MCRVAVLSAMQQLAEALGTQFQSVYALYNDRRHICNLAERQSSDRVTYVPYSAVGTRQEIVQLLRLTRKISPDVIYVNSLRHLLAICASVRLSKPFGPKPIVIAASHNSAVWQSSTKRLLIAFLLRFFPDGVLTLADFQRQWLRQYGLSASKIRTIANPVDTDQFSPRATERAANSPDCPVLINIADLRPIKSQDTLIRVINLLKNKFPWIKLILMGGQYAASEYGRYLRSLIVELHLEENVINIGDVEHDRIPGLLNSSDISVMSSLSEVCPSAVLESLAAGKVMISTAVGGVPDLIKDGLNGFLIKPGDIQGYADCIVRVLTDRSMRISIEKNARETAESEYSYRVVGEKHWEFVAALLRNRAGVFESPLKAD